MTGPIEYRIDIISDERLRKWGSQDEEEPVKVGGRELSIGCLVHVMRGADVHHNEFGEPIRMVERQTMAYARSPVMTDHSELSKAKLFHYFDLVQSHGTL
jgi:hypothetical protein